ncbi:MAG: methyltransferase domain-containing protein [Lentisphaeria bacterium]
MKQEQANLKRHAKARFRAAAATYDTQPGVQPLVADKVEAMVATALGRAAVDDLRILEIGCGTGTLTARLVERYPNAAITAVDVAETMVEQARRRLGNRGNVIWQAADAQHLEVRGKFSLVVSSSALHWLQPLPQVLTRLVASLRPGGEFVCGLMVRGTLEELHALRNEVAPRKRLRRKMPEPDKVKAAIAASGLDVVDSHVEKLVVDYPSAAEFLRTLNRQGVTGGIYAPAKALHRREIRHLIQEYEKRYARPENGGVWATYKVMFIRANN